MTRRSELRKTRRHYAVLGYIAQHGPCSAADIAVKLGYRVVGLAMDLVVQDVIWHQVTPVADETDPRKRLYTLPASRTEEN